MTPPKIYRFTLQKQMEEADSNEDAFDISIKKDIVAIADGLTTSPASGIWSKIIVKNFTERPFNDDNPTKEFLIKWLEKAMVNFESTISSKVDDEFVVDMIKTKGAATTLLGCRIYPNLKSHDVKIWAIGDSNCFHIRKNNIISAFPISKLEGFSNKTYALNSIVDRNNFNFKFTIWKIKSGDKMILSTDAFSKWFLWASLNGQKPAKKIKKKLSKNTERMNRFQNYVEKLRSKKKINDDDITLIYLEF